MRIVVLLLSIFCIAASCFAQTQTQSQTQTQTQPQDEPPPSTDIYLLSWPPPADAVAKIRNITHREGYDNQPMFSPDGGEFYFTSIGKDEQADIYSYSIRSGDTKRVTQTPESEYSPTVMPDRRHLSVVRVETDKEKTQRLWKFPLSAGTPSLILEKIKPVGYHCWIDENRVALFILGEPNTLQIADIRTGTAEKIADDIGRSMHKIPGSGKISFTMKEKEAFTINELDPETHEVHPIVKAVDTSEDYIWTKDGRVLMAAGTILYEWDPSHPAQSWKKVADLTNAGIGKITRLAFNPQGTLLAFVAEEKSQKP